MILRFPHYQLLVKTDYTLFGILTQVLAISGRGASVCCSGTHVHCPVVLLHIVPATVPLS